MSEPEPKTYRLTPEEEVAFLEGLRSEREDPTCTLEEAIAYAREQRKKWLKDPKNRTAS